MAASSAVLCMALLGLASAAFLEKQSAGQSLAKQIEELKEQELLVEAEEEQVRKQAERQAVLGGAVEAEQDAADSEAIRNTLSRQQAIIELQSAQAKKAQIEAEEEAKEEAKVLRAEPAAVTEEKQEPKATETQVALVEEESATSLNEQLNLILMAVSGGAFEGMPLEAVTMWRDFAMHMQKALAGKEPTSKVEDFAKKNKAVDPNLHKMMNVVEKLSQSGQIPASLPECLEVMKRSVLLAHELRRPKNPAKPRSAMQIMQEVAPYLPSPEEDESVASALAVAQKVERLSKKAKTPEALMQAWHDSMAIAKERTALEEAWESMRDELKAARVAEIMEDATMPKDLDTLREEVEYLAALKKKEGLTKSTPVDEAENKGSLFQAAADGSESISKAAELAKEKKRAGHMQRIVSALGEVDEDIEANHAHLMKVQERALAMNPELANLKKMLTAAGKEMRGRDADWAKKENADLAKKSNEISSLLETSKANLAMSESQKLELVAERTLSLLATAADAARETLPVSKSEEDEWKFVEKFSSTLTKMLRAGGHKLNEEMLNAALAKAQRADVEGVDFSKAQIIHPLATALMQRHSIAAPMDNDILYADEFGKILYRVMYAQK